MNVIVAVVEPSVKLVESEYCSVHVAVYVHIVVLQGVAQLFAGVLLDLLDSCLCDVPCDSDRLRRVIDFNAIVYFRS